MDGAKLAVFTTEQRQRVLQVLEEERVPLSVAAAAAGVPRRVIAQWMDLGERVAAGAVSLAEPGAAEALEFWRRARRFLAEGAIEAFEAVRAKALSGDHRAAQWLFSQYVEDLDSQVDRDGSKHQSVVAVVFNLPDGTQMPVKSPNIVDAHDYAVLLPGQEEQQAHSQPTQVPGEGVEE